MVRLLRVRWKSVAARRVALTQAEMARTIQSLTVIQRNSTRYQTCSSSISGTSSLSIVLTASRSKKSTMIHLALVRSTFQKMVPLIMITGTTLGRVRSMATRRWTCAWEPKVEALTRLERRCGSLHSHRIAPRRSRVVCSTTIRSSSRSISRNEEMTTVSKTILQALALLVMTHKASSVEPTRTIAISNLFTNTKKAWRTAGLKRSLSSQVSAIRLLSL